MNWSRKFRSKLPITTKNPSNNNHAEQQTSATLCQILRYAHGADYLWLAIGLITSLISSTVTPAVNILYSEAVNLFIDFDYWHRTNPPNMTSSAVIDQKRSEFLRTNWQILWMFTTICLTSFLSSFGTLYSFQIFSLRLTRTVKRLYFAAILRQEIAWFDKCNPGQFASRVAIDFKKFQNVFNENMAIFLYNVFTAILLLLMSLVYGWKLFLALLSVAPLMGINSLVCMKFLQHYTRKEMTACSMASSVAEEAISAIRTVFAFSGQRKEAQRYETQLKSSMIYGCKRNFFTAVGVAMNLTLIYLAFGFGIWYGTILINDPHEHYTIARVLIVFWGVASAGIRLNNTAPFNEAIETGKVAAKAIFEVIERKPLIDSAMKFIGQCSDNYQANIEFQDVHFAYPSRMDVKVLRGLNLRINSGETIALVGPSGCGKSTTIQLIQRFYDVDRGKVLLDGQDIRFLNVGWLRQQLGVVGQEPVLFDASIEENIRLGMPFNQMDQITMADIQRAAKEANAHDFIKKLPLGYQTHVGDRGTQLSGGQKQRIAIARALIGKPKILLLDEATSALDLASEQTVQLALDRASRNCTTVIIAHRLSTIINADRIIYIDQGEVVEQGTHDALMAQRGRYYDLVQAQQVLEQSIHQLDHHPEMVTTLDEPRKRSRAATMHSDQGDYLVEGQSNGVVANVANNNNNGNNAEEQERLKKVSNQRLLALIWHDKFYCIVAIISASIYGLSSSLYALIFGEFVDVFAQSQDPDYRTRNTLVQSFYCVLLALSNLIFGTLQISLSGIVGEKLTKRLRMMAYEAILRQDVSFFDEKANSAGALCSRLSSDAAHVQGATGLRVSMICQAASMILFTILIGVVVNWRLLLASIMLMPMVALSSLMMSTTFSNQAKDDSEAEERSSKILIEATNAIRTVVSLHKEQYFYAILEQNLDQHHRISKRTCLFKSIILGISLTCSYLAYTVSFWYGGYLICYGLLKSGDFFKIVESTVLGAYMVGQSAVFSQDVTKAKMASMNIFQLIDRTTSTTTTTNVDVHVLEQQRSHDLNLRSKGNVSFESVHFSYPSRPEAKVLNGLSFRANQGQTVALVGTSGCGKSTSLQLLERFYDCVDGMILLDGANIARVPVEWLRAQMSLVQQEPILFSYSIGENIAYGDNTRSVPLCDIQQAAMMANVHDFISELPEGYDTPVGAKGVCQLSGGQKQRIAIARALLRNPPILLLDEATSALDTESEQIVQRALDKASRNRTCLVIAHRLKTIINADRIVVMDKGRKVEEGTHQELLARREHYWRLYNKAISPKPPSQPKQSAIKSSSSSSSSNQQFPVITITEPK